jgi:hypothetical protein
MRTYTFTHTRADGSKKTYTIEAETLTVALTIYRAKVKEDESK